MAAKDRFSQAGEAVRAAQRNRYLQRLMEDDELRGSLLAAYGAARNAYGRMTNGKPAAQAGFEDRKLQRELREAANARSVERPAQASQAPAPRRDRPLLAADRDRRGARDSAQREPALEGARPALRRGGGLRLQLDHGPQRARTGRRLDLLSEARSALRRSHGRTHA